MNLFGLDDDRMTQVMYGIHARRGAGWLVVRPASDDGKAVMVMGVMAAGNLIWPGGEPGADQMLHGDITVRPSGGVWTGNYCRGDCASGILTGDAFDPRNWEKQLVETQQSFM